MSAAIDALLTVVLLVLVYWLAESLAPADLPICSTDADCCERYPELEPDFCFGLGDWERP